MFLYPLISIRTATKKLTSTTTWESQLELLNTATLLMKELGTKESNDFNIFKASVESILKSEGIKLSTGEKNQIWDAVTWYDEKAVKVIKKTQKLSTEKLTKLIEHLGCREDQLSDYGYYPTGKSNEFTIYESESDLRDTETVPLKETVYDYFLGEVKPHVDEAWIDLEKTKIGYEISFNKYFYQHKPLRSLEEVTADILELEKASEGLISEILNF